MKAFLEPSGSLWCSCIQTSPLLLVSVKSCSESLPGDFSVSKPNFCFLSKITLRCMVGNPPCWTISSYSFPLYFSAPNPTLTRYMPLKTCPCDQCSTCALTCWSSLQDYVNPKTRAVQFQLCCFFQHPTSANISSQSWLVSLSLSTTVVPGNAKCWTSSRPLGDSMRNKGLNKPGPMHLSHSHLIRAYITFPII